MFIDCEIEDKAVEDQFRLTRDNNGNCIYTKVGEVDISEYVNSFRNTSALDSVLSRIQFLPIREKISSLNMVNDGVSADTSILPKDGTEAFIILKKYEKEIPIIKERMDKGESFEAIITSIFSPKNNTVKENNNNGETESSND